MTDPTPLHYQSYGPSEGDINNLRVLSILHYVWGGLIMLISCFFILYIVLGAFMASGSMNSAFSTTVTVNGATTQTIQTSQPPPAAIGYVFVGMGSCAIVVGWATGILTIVSGRKMAARKSRVFSIVIAGLNCLSFPLGTVLGVFHDHCVVETVGEGFATTPVQGIAEFSGPFSDGPRGRREPSGLNNYDPARTDKSLVSTHLSESHALGLVGDISKTLDIAVAQIQHTGRESDPLSPGVPELPQNSPKITFARGTAGPMDAELLLKVPPGSHKVDVVFCRFSSFLQRDDSNENQARRCFEWLNNKNISLHNFIVIQEEAVTGTKDDRPGMRLLEILMKRQR